MFARRRNPFSKLSAFVAMLLVVSAGLAHNANAAAPVENTQCILGQPGAPNGLNCTANDVTLSSPAITVIENCQFPGDTAILQVLADVTGTAQTRYDVGVWVSVDGDPNGDGSETGICSVVSIPNDILDTNGASVNIDGDNCGDVANTGNLTDINQADLGTFSVLCNDSDGDGQLNLPLIISWDNQAGGVCAASTDTLPNTPAKCRANIDNNIPVPVPGRLFVNKTTTGGDPTAFDFTLTGADSGIVGGFTSPYDFQLSNGGQLDSATAFTGGLLAGAYSLTEAAAVGWIGSGSCSSDVDGGNTDPASLNLRAGETITCNFVNTPDTATLTVVKQSIGGTEEFNFTLGGDIPDSPFTVDTSVTNPVQQQFPGLAAGSYDLTENIPVGWSLNSASCTGATSNGTVDLGAGTITGIQIAGGQNVTCTFVDAAGGTITVTKLTEGGDAQFGFTSSFISDFNIQTSGGSGSVGTTYSPQGQFGGWIEETPLAGWELISASCTGATSSSTRMNGEDVVGVDLTLDDGQTVACTFTNRKLGSIVVMKETLPDGAQGSFTFTGDAAGSIGDGQMITVSDLSPGAYSSAETVPVGWDLTDISCDDANSTGNVGDATASFNLEAGETVTCTFTNTQQASLTVEKVLDGDPAGLTTSFAYTRSFGADFNLDPVNTPASMQFDNLQPNMALTVTETIPTTTGWALLSATCGVGETVNLGTGTVSNIVLDPGEQATCTFTNTIPTLELLKTGTLDDGGDGVANVGDTINYVFTVTNTGKVLLSNIVVTDTNPDVIIVGSPIESLAPGAVDSTTVTGSYTLTQADIDAGTFDNTATATGDCPQSEDCVTDDDDDRQPLVAGPAVMLDKVGTLNDDDGTPGISAGDTIDYTFTVTNTGNITLTNVTVTDPLITVSGGPLASLAPLAVDNSTFSGSYTLTQADIDAETFTNTATATGDCPQTQACATDNDDDTQPLINEPAIMLEKVGTLNDDDGTAGVSAGDTITYAFTVTNTGNVLLTNIAITDPVVTVMGGPLASLAPSAVDSTTFTASYVLTQVDIDAGSFTNTATVTGDCPGGLEDCASDDDDDTQQLTPPPRPPGEPQAIPVNKPWAILLLTLMVLALGWYFRPPMRRNC
jgi:uncharacterized repeat protein (TIGR01451 family)